MLFFSSFVRICALTTMLVIGSVTTTNASEPQTNQTVSKSVRIRTVTPDFAVAPQLNLSDIQRAAAKGYTRIINNRPDGEGGSDQPASAALARAAKEAGIEYLYIPFRSGHVTEDAFEQTKLAFADHAGKTVSFCRSGTRAITIWAMAQSALGTMSPEETIRAARQAGYDLGRKRAQLNALAADQAATE